MKNLKLKVKNLSHTTYYILHATKSKGQALIGVLAVVAISSVIVSSLVLNSLISADTSLRLRQSGKIVNQAETALQNSILRLERDTTYLGETLNFSDGQVIIEVTGDNPKSVTVKSLTGDGKILRRLQLEVNFDSNGIATVDNWVEL